MYSLDCVTLYNVAYLPDPSSSQTNLYNITPTFLQSPPSSNSLACIVSSLHVPSSSTFTFHLITNASPTPLPPPISIFPILVIQTYLLYSHFPHMVPLFIYLFIISINS